MGIEPETSSAWNATTPTVLHRSYNFFQALKTIGVTVTNQGITNRQILLGMADGQVQGLDYNFFDPNRVVNPSPEDREEGLIPYAASLPRNTFDYITHGHAVADMRGIVTRKTVLESSSLVLVYGLDLLLAKSTVCFSLYFIITQPVGGFDVLNDDFNYSMLILTVVVMLIITEYTIRAVKEKELADAWR